MALTPVTRDEHYLAKAGGQDVPTPTPVPGEEQYLAKLSGQDVIVPTPITRREKFLYAASGGDIELPSEDKMRRIEKFMAKAGGRDVTTPTAVTREEQFWDAIIAESGIKTLTGKLPLFFRTSDTKLRDWTIHGNNDVGKNLLEITGEDEFITRGITFSHDKSNHTIRVNGQATGNAFYACGDVTLKAGVQYVLSGCPAGGSASGTYTYQLYIAGHSDWGSDTGDGLTLPVMTEDTVVTPHIGVYTGAGELTDLIFKPMLRKAGASADFEPYQIGVGKLTKNVVNLDGVAQMTKGNVMITADATTGYVTVSTRDSEVTNTEAIMQIYLPAGISGDYYLSGSPNDGSETRTYDIYPWDETQSARPTKWDGVTQARSSIGDTPQEVKLIAGNIYRIGIRIRSGVAADGLVFKPMIRAADTGAEFIPYGYQIPLDVRDDMTGEYIYAHDIFIGESPLTEGKSISKSSTGIDIQTIADQENYPNILTTALTNKPVMMIKYKE